MGRAQWYLANNLRPIINVQMYLEMRKNRRGEKYRESERAHNIVECLSTDSFCATGTFLYHRKIIILGIDIHIRWSHVPFISGKVAHLSSHTGYFLFAFSFFTVYALTSIRRKRYLSLYRVSGVCQCVQILEWAPCACMPV